MSARTCALLALVILAAPAAALAADAPSITAARAAFDFGDYQKARELAQELLKSNVLTSDKELVDAHRIIGLCWYYGEDAERLDSAEDSFLQLLFVDPDFKLDPFFTPPQAVTFFEGVRAKYAEQLRPIREQKERIKAERKREEELRLKGMDEARRVREKAAAPRVKEVTHRSVAVALLPLGAGQFQNGDATAGTVLAGVQVIAGGTSVASWLVIEGMRDSVSRDFPSGRYEVASTLDTVRLVSAIVFYAAWGYGVYDSLANYEPETVKEYEVTSPADKARPAAESPPSPSAPGVGSGSSPAPLSPGARLAPPDAPAILPFTGAAPGGGVLGLSLRF